MPNLTVALGQFTVGPNPQDNLSQALALVREAGERGARLLVLPEGIQARDRAREGWFAASALEAGSPFLAALVAESARNGVALCAAVHEKTDGPLVADTAFIADGGQILARYRKLHLYAAFGGGEPKWIVPGDAPSPVVTVDGWRVAMMVCYDLRFPELARRLALDGAELLAVPASWVAGPGKRSHWELAVRARALDNTVYVAASGECGPDRVGCSLAAGPLGEVCVQAQGGSGLVCFEADRQALLAARRDLPVLANRRFADPLLAR